MDVPTKKLSALLIALGCNTAFAQQNVSSQTQELASDNAAPCAKKQQPVFRNTISYAHSDIAGYSGPGLNYDRIIDRRGKWAINATVAFGYRNNDALKNFQVAPFKGVGFFMAGVRYEITRPTSRFHYSITASLIAGKGQRMSDWSHETWSEETGDQSITYNFHPYSMFGVLLTQSVSYDITKHWQIGGDIGIGQLFSAKEFNKPLSNTRVPQLAFRIGFKF